MTNVILHATKVVGLARTKAPGIQRPNWSTALIRGTLHHRSHSPHAPHFPQTNSFAPVWLTQTPEPPARELVMRWQMASLHRNDSPQVSDGKWSVSYGDEGSSLVQIEHSVLLIKDLQRQTWKTASALNSAQSSTYSHVFYSLLRLLCCYSMHAGTALTTERKNKKKTKPFSGVLL